MTAQEFITAYQPANAYQYAIREKQCHNGQCPTFAQAVAQYGVPAILSLVNDYMVDLAKYCHASLPPDIREELAKCIIAMYRRMKISQFVLFCVKCKAGHFGKFYNTIEAMDITARLNEWQTTCRTMENNLQREAWDTFQNMLRYGEIEGDKEFCEAIKFYDPDGQLTLIFKA